MIRVDVGLDARSYPIHVGHGCLGDIGQACRDVGLGTRVAVVTNPTVAELYLEPVRGSLADAGLSVSVATMPDGEAHKTLSTAGELLGSLIESGLDRGSAVVTLGGGVTGDVGGFVAATFMRGIPFVQVPTSLEAQVDASVGGKTAVDHTLGKNLVGAFHQPSMVFIDTATLKTLPDEELQAGLAEVVKHGLIRDPELVEFLESNLVEVADRAIDPDQLDWLIARNCRIKADVVEADETEMGLREILNYGHTLGHAVEAASGFTIRHGEAVLTGMVAAGKIAVEKGVLSDAAFGRQQRLIGALRPKWADVTEDRLFELMQADKKARDGVIRFVLLHEVGKAVSHDDVSENEVREAIRFSKEFVGG